MTVNSFFLSFLRNLIQSIPTATSNAPTIGRKRRISDEDGDDDDVRDAGSSRKRRAPLEREDTGTSDLGELRVKGTETDPAVKEVTRGVKEVELEDKKEGSATDDGKGTAEEASTTPEGEGESNIAPPHDPAQRDDRPSTVPSDDEESPIVTTEAIAEEPANDSPDERTPEEPLAQVADEKESTDVVPDASDDEVAPAAELVSPTSELDTTTSSPKANKQPEQ